MKKQSGFVIMAALGLGFVLAASSIAILMMKRSVDNDTRNNGIKHAKAIAEDIIRSQIAIQTKEMLHRDLLNQFVETYIATGSPGGFRIAIPGTEKLCDGDSCYLQVINNIDDDDNNNLPPKSYVPIDPHKTPVEDYLSASNATEMPVTFILGVRKADNEKLKFKIEPIPVTVILPKEDDMQNNTVSYTSDMKCPLKTPVFKGVKTVGKDSQIQCEAISMNSANATVTMTASTLQIQCSISGGYWMSSMNANMTPACLHFPEGTRSPASLNICDGDQVPKFYELGSIPPDVKFAVKNATCIDRGGPYDFMQQKQTWAH